MFVRIQAWAPGHATLIFAVSKQYEDPQLQGSLGIGLNFNTGVLTAIEPASENIVKWNSRVIDGRVTLTALEKFHELTQMTGNFEINHYSELKVGHGLSTSGAGSLGVVLGLDEFYGTHLDRQSLYQIAHYADVVNHTGLGSVMGQITGGIEIRTKQGGPGTGKTISIQNDSDIIILMMDKLQTSDVLTSSQQMELVNKAGLNIIEKINSSKDDVSLEEILHFGFEFTEKCGLMTDRVRDTMDALRALGEDKLCMAMIGETIIVMPNNASRILDYAQRHRIDTVVTKISNTLPDIIRLEG